MTRLSPRLAEIVAALPLRPGMRIVEIGCGPGAAARAVAELVGPRGHVLAVDRSERAISRVQSTAADLIAEGRMSTRLARAEELHLQPGEDPYHLAFAVRVGGFDGRHPERRSVALARVHDILFGDGRFFIDGGDPLREVCL